MGCCNSLCTLRSRPACALIYAGLNMQELGQEDYAVLDRACLTRLKIQGDPAAQMTLALFQNAVGSSESEPSTWDEIQVVAFTQFNFILLTTITALFATVVLRCMIHLKRRHD